jgi:hypothetical protein
MVVEAEQTGRRWLADLRSSDCRQQHRHGLSRREFRVITFRNHGRIDTGIAALVAAMPRFMKFKEEPEARFFSILASSETTLAGMTDFGYYEEDSARGAFARLRMTAGRRVNASNSVRCSGGVV